MSCPIKRIEMCPNYYISEYYKKARIGLWYVCLSKHGFKCKDHVQLYRKTALDVFNGRTNFLNLLHRISFYVIIKWH